MRERLISAQPPRPILFRQNGLWSSPDDPQRRRAGVCDARAASPRSHRYRPAICLWRPFRNIEQALADVVRGRYYVPNPVDWPAIVPVLGEIFGTIRPAATALFSGLVDPRMKIEIEVTARRGGAIAS